MSTFSYVFPGQGSQTVGMLADFEAHPIVRDTFAEASEALGYDLWQLVQAGPESELNQTQITQPAILTASVAIYRVLQAEKNIAVSCMAGHSLGEYSALVCAGVIAFTDAVKLVEKRGEYMQQAVPAGTGAMMAIIGLDDETIISACDDASNTGVVAPVNFNSPGQVVIAGEKVAVAKAGELCKERGAKRALPLPVSVPSHCALMKPAAAKLAADLDGISFSKATVDVINNVDVKIETDAVEIKKALVRQLYSPVRWTESVEAMAKIGVTNLIEVGPGKVLTGLTKRIDKGLTACAVNSQASLESI